MTDAQHVEPVDPDDLVATHWPHPYYTADQLTAAVRTARELIRWANHATLNAPAETMVYAAHAGTVAAGLHDLTGGLEQLARQVAGRVGEIAEDPNLYHDQGGDPGAAAATAAAELDAAAAKSAELSEVFGRAWQQLNRLGHRITD